MSMEKVQSKVRLRVAFSGQTVEPRTFFVSMILAVETCARNRAHILCEKETYTRRNVRS